MACVSTRAKWRALRSARVCTLKKYLTPPTLSEKRCYNISEHILRSHGRLLDRGSARPGGDQHQRKHRKCFGKRLTRYRRSRRYAAHFCQSEICNGGFEQLFYNGTGASMP